MIQLMLPLHSFKIETDDEGSEVLSDLWVTHLINFLQLVWILHSYVCVICFHFRKGSIAAEW